jgi:hypothetical protein
MHENQLNRLINKMNRGGSKLIFTQVIGDNVEYSKIWPTKPKKSELRYDHCRSSDFYFLKNPDNSYAGVVYDMGNDLHWFLRKKERKNGLMYNALKKFILPHIIETKRDDIQISIDKNVLSKENFEASRNLALKLGFVENEEGRYCLDTSDLDLSFLDEKLGGLTSNRLNEIQKEITCLFRQIKMIADEMELKYGEDRSIARLRKNASEIYEFNYRLDELLYHQSEL